MSSIASASWDGTTGISNATSICKNTPVTLVMEGFALMPFYIFHDMYTNSTGICR